MALDYDVFATRCPSRATLELVTSRWGTLVLAALLDVDRSRFGDLRRKIDGISDKMLSQTLKQLQSGGLVTRQQHDELAQQVDYGLTEAGRTVATAVVAMVHSIYEVQPEL